MSRSAYLKFKKGVPLSRIESMSAQCYECNGYSLEQKDDCKGISCPLYQWSPWQIKLKGAPRTLRSEANRKNAKIAREKKQQTLNFAF